MAHLVPDPPPADYQVPKLTKFSIRTADGIGKILAWGLSPTTWQWRVGTDIADQVLSTASPSTYPDLTEMTLRGVRKGMKIAIFTNLGSGSGWTRYSPYVDIEENTADHYASGTLPKSVHSPRISYYPFGSMHAYQPLSETDWKNKIEAAVEKIATNAVGASVLRSLKRDVVIYPYLPWYKNAWSDVRINPVQWEGDWRPGAFVDEILLHELIHVIETNGGSYQDRYGFMFDKTDFLSVNATNVYSCMLGRALRKDHHDFQFLPDEHFRSPRTHYDQQKPNYKIAEGSAGDLFKTLSKVEGVWNPFRF